MPRPTFDIRAIIRTPQFVTGASTLLVFLLVAAVLVNWSREQVKVRDGQIMADTRLTRTDYVVVDREATEAKRAEAAKSAPRVYTLNDSYLSRIHARLSGLPAAVAGKQRVDDIGTELRDQFDLTDLAMAALQAHVRQDSASESWQRWCDSLTIEELTRTPLIESREYGEFSTTLRRALVLPNGELEQPLRVEGIEIRTDDAAYIEARLQELVMRAGFPRDVAPIIVAGLRHDLQPTLLFNPAHTQRLADEAANRVPDVRIAHRKGEIIYRRGDVLTPVQYEEVKTEAAEFAADREAAAAWMPRAGVTGLLLLLVLFAAGVTGLSNPRIARNPLRTLAIAFLLLAMLAISTVVTVQAPIFLFPAAIAPTLFATIVLLLAYDQRVAFILATLQSLLVTLALEQSAAMFVLLAVTNASAIIQLREVRHRNSLVRAATGTAAVLGAGAIVVSLVDLPPVPELWSNLLILGASGVAISYGVSFLVLGILPSIERLFDITTGMTLAELRDPKQPLLRQLQQKAPGTYNHSLQVANIAEAAAEAIGANGLLVYVGALYHDVGKMNKPDYFVENQAGGYNKHTKLSPAMSLLVIIGHVKDGMELAREYGLPRAIQHFIESHHGTTLVEYFYHAARTKADADDEAVAEIEYRYPGPRPRTREAAILMLSDAVESSARAMADPSPSRIESLVRRLSQKRLEDGQFDESNLTFKELRTIEDAIITRLNAIHHSRIAYPTSRPSEEAPAASNERGTEEAAAPALRAS